MPFARPLAGFGSRTACGRALKGLAFRLPETMFAFGSKWRLKDLGESAMSGTTASRLSSLSLDSSRPEMGVRLPELRPSSQLSCAHGLETPAPRRHAKPFDTALASTTS